jgi:hypothetical protein
MGRLPGHPNGPRGWSEIGAIRSRFSKISNAWGPTAGGHRIRKF